MKKFSPFIKSYALWMLMGLIIFSTLVLHRRIEKVIGQNRVLGNNVSSGGQPSCSDPVDFLLGKAFGRFGIRPKGIIHLGAHKAEEVAIYQKYGVKDVLWVEANPAMKPFLEKRLKNHPGSRIAIFAAADSEGEATFFIPTHHTSCSSLLKPTGIKDTWHTEAEKKEEKEVTVQKKRLDDVLAVMKDKPPYNVTVLDVQGGEKLALLGAEKTLESIDAIVMEVDFHELYKGGAHIHDLDDLLRKKGYVRVETQVFWPKVDGDALYVRQEIITKALSKPASR